MPERARGFNYYSTMRGEMLDDTVRFLTWALAHPQYFRRIPRVPVDSGVKFSERIKVAWWGTALDELRRIPYDV